MGRGEGDSCSEQCVRGNEAGGRWGGGERDGCSGECVKERGGGHKRGKGMSE